MILRRSPFPLAAPPSTPQSRIRLGHLQRALDLIARAPGTMTRAAIARQTGLTSATSSSLVHELLALGLASESAFLASTGGKPATGLVLSSKFVVCVALVSAHTIETILISISGEYRDLTTTRISGDLAPGDVLAAIEEATNDVREELLGVCIQTPGVSEEGVVVTSVLLGWQNVPLAERVSRTVDTPVVVLNDAKAEALTDAAFDEHEPRQRLFVRLGEGIGAAVVEGTGIAPGAHRRAGEIGHVEVAGPPDPCLPADPDYPARCDCGTAGCLESFASLRAMLGPEYHDELGTKQVRALAEEPDARRRLHAGAHVLARALTLLAALIDPSEIVIGGAAPALGPAFLETLRAEFSRRPARGTAAIPLRYARTNGATSASHPDRFMGPARHALIAALGVPLVHPNGRLTDHSNGP